MCLCGVHIEPFGYMPGRCSAVSLSGFLFRVVSLSLKDLQADFYSSLTDVYSHQQWMRAPSPDCHIISGSCSVPFFK